MIASLQSVHFSNNYSPVTVEMLGPYNEMAYKLVGDMADASQGYLAMTVKVLFVSTFVCGGATL